MANLKCKCGKFTFERLCVDCFIESRTLSDKKTKENENT